MDKLVNSEKNSFVWTGITALLGFTGVALGAFGAHALKEHITPELMETWKTGVFYQLVHVPVMLLLIHVPALGFRKPLPWLLSGIMLFSFSLYLLVITGIRLFGLITPIGGVALLIGWGLLAYSAFRKSSDG